MRHSIVAAALVLAFTPAAFAQVQDDDSSSATMRPVIRGRQAAVTSMKPEATEAARRILQAGGNAFDAAVAGQAALGVTDFPSNGAGSDALILLYDAKAKKVVSINAEPRAPRLATIEWFSFIRSASRSQCADEIASAPSRPISEILAIPSTTALSP